MAPGFSAAFKSTATVAPETRARVLSVDALRGLAMVIMALDHVREFFHTGAMRFQPEDLTQTTPILFFTRWITHMCAPTFMFTAGIGAFFWLRRGHSTAELTAFLVKRGVWLIVLDQVVLRFAMFFSLTSGAVILNVLWALGWSMVVLGLLVYLPLRALAAISFGVIVLHNLADKVNAAQFGSAGWVWNILHQPGLLMAGTIPVLVAYPLVPWFAVMAAGFCFGHLFTLEPERRRRWTMRIGLGATICFFALRWANFYGDPSPWSSQKTAVMTVLSFLRCTKYPPSLDFLLMTLGPALLLLYWFESARSKAAGVLVLFGRVPLFYFLLHFFVAHLLTFPLAYLKYGQAAFLLNPLPSMGGDPKLYPAEYGYSLAVVYAVWISVVLIMYPLCRWFKSVKERRRDWWIQYL